MAFGPCVVAGRIASPRVAGRKKDRFPFKLSHFTKAVDLGPPVAFAPTRV
jgi:hypothetical protein